MSQVQNLIQEIPVAHASEMLAKDLKEYGVDVTYINVRSITEIIIHVPKDVEMPIYTGFTGIFEYQGLHIDFDRTNVNIELKNGIVYEFRNVIPYFYEKENVLKIYACENLSKVSIYDINKIINILLTM